MSERSTDEELVAVYAEAAEDKIFFAEYSGLPAAAGDIRDLEHLAKIEGCEPQELLEKMMSSFMGAIVDLCVLGDCKGDDRVANCRAALLAAREAREKGFFPRSVDVREALGMEVSGAPHQLGTF